MKRFALPVALALSAVLLLAFHFGCNAEQAQKLQQAGQTGQYIFNPNAQPPASQPSVIVVTAHEAAAAGAQTPIGQTMNTAGYLVSNLIAAAGTFLIGKYTGDKSWSQTLAEATAATPPTTFKGRLLSPNTVKRLTNIGRHDLVASATSGPPTSA